MNLKTSEATGLQSFHNFVEKQLASNSTSPMSPEEALAAWREEQVTLAAIREGLEDIAAGELSRSTILTAIFAGVMVLKGPHDISRPCLGTCRTRRGHSF